MIKIIKSNIYLIASVLLTALFILGALYFSNNKVSSSDTVVEKYKVEKIEENANNVSVVDGKQIIELRAKGGFSPIHSIAKANIPTILRVDTEGTFDCSSVIRIPSLDLSENLPMSGTTDIDIGVQKVATLDGTCGMGMYPFDIKFE
jgi:plastocyanin domain-containing protein